MRKSQPIEIEVHMPKDIKAFEKAYIEATFEAIKQIKATMPKTA